MHPERWENGSAYHWPDPRSFGFSTSKSAQSTPWASGLLLSSGRDALRLLLDHGVRQRGWRRFWVPEYFCQTVTAALVRPGLDVRPYRDHPLRSSPDLPRTRQGDVILVMNYFGLRAPVAIRRRDGVEVIEDHSHDPVSPWARESTADFAIASLRKTMPLPDGGALWSPVGHETPPGPALTAQRRRAAATQLGAMVLKAMYLDGQPVDKLEYRALQIRGEKELGVPGVSAMSDVARAVLGSWAIERWRRLRRSNFIALRRTVTKLPWAHVLTPAAGGCAPFSCVVIVDSASRREHLRLGLIAARVYPAVLWPLERTVLPVGAEARELSRRLLSIHCDGRYGPEDMRRVGRLLAQIGDGWQGGSTAGAAKRPGG